MYYDKVMQDVSKVIEGFFLEERGNRVTSNNIQGLSFKMKAVLDTNRVPKKERPPKRN